MERVVIDTYALMAMIFGELTEKAERALLDVRYRRKEGILPSTVAYEFFLQWLRGRIPFKSDSEVKGFLLGYFRVVNFKAEDYIEMAKLKYEGDRILQQSNFKDNRLSLVDASILLVSLREEAPIVSGDDDLRYVASMMGIEILW
jgi:predicted nucleic acid-binding protein